MFRMASKPHILICATPVYGHTMPLRAVSRALINRGFTITFLTGSDFKDSIESIGATFVSLEGDADLTAAKLVTGFKNLSKDDPAGLHELREEIHRSYFVEIISEQFKGVQKALESIYEREGNAKEVVVLVESNFRGALPGMLGASGLKVAGYVGIGIIPIGVDSLDTAPFGPGVLPDSSPEGQKRNAALSKGREAVFIKSQQRFIEQLKSLGARDTITSFMDANYWHVNRFVQMCAPSFEYPR
jgi:hypothetical protein